MNIYITYLYRRSS